MGYLSLSGYLNSGCGCVTVMIGTCIYGVLVIDGYVCSKFTVYLELKYLLREAGIVGE